MARLMREPLNWVPAGWTAESWRRECIRHATASREVRPDEADEWQRRAEALEAEQRGEDDE